MAAGAPLPFMGIWVQFDPKPSSLLLRTVSSPFFTNWDAHIFLPNKIWINFPTASDIFIKYTIPASVLLLRLAQPNHISLLLSVKWNRINFIACDACKAIFCIIVGWLILILFCILALCPDQGMYWTPTTASILFLGRRVLYFTPSTTSYPYWLSVANTNRGEVSMSVRMLMAIR